MGAPDGICYLLTRISYSTWPALLLPREAHHVAQRCVGRLSKFWNSWEVTIKVRRFLRVSSHWGIPTECLFIFYLIDDLMLGNCCLWLVMSSSLNL